MAVPPVEKNGNTNCGEPVAVEKESVTSRTIGVTKQARTYGASANVRYNLRRMSDFEVVGCREVCAWKVAPAVVWVQTRCPDMAKRLAWLTRNPQPRLVVRGCAGGYSRRR
jgi:hypothetical protein